MNEPQIKSLLQFTSKNDKLLIATGIFCGIVYSFKYIVLAIVLGEVGATLTAVSMDKLYSQINADLNVSLQRNAFHEHYELNAFQQQFGLEADLAAVVSHAIFEMIFILSLAAIGNWLCYFGMNITLEKAAANQTNKIRLAFVSSLLRQDIMWFDSCNTSKFISQSENDLKLYQDGIGFKLVYSITHISSFLLPVFYSFALQWRLALVGYSTIPLFIITYKVTSLVQRYYSAKESKSFSNAGIIAEDVLTAFKTVISFNGQLIETQRYSRSLVEGRKNGLVKAILTALCHALFLSTLVGTFALSGWYAHYLYKNLPGYALQKNTVANLIGMIILINKGGMKLGEIFGIAHYVSLALSSGKRILDIINRIPEYDSHTNDVSMTTVEKIEFDCVDFSYSNRKDTPVLRNVSMDIKKGECVALVGHSGCGKSTIVNLLCRFYDPIKGSININGVNLKNINLDWFLSEIGVVSQEPILFPTTVYENIRYGYSQATEEDIKLAAKMANVHDFIMDLPKQYESKVGDRGSQLSGGQKQRIAIARAIVRKPSVLLLDEATSALDSQSEMIVQEALEQACVGRTIIVIAHRLSTIRNANKIIVLNEGQVVEVGNHNSLMEAKSFYFDLVKAQMDNINEIDVALNKKENESSNNDLKMSASKTIKAEDLTAMFKRKKSSKTIELPIGLKKVRKWNLRSFRKHALFRLLSLGGWGPVYFCFGIIAGFIQGFAFMEIFVNVVPLTNYIFEYHDPNNVNGLHLYLQELLVFGTMFVVADFVMAFFSELSGCLMAERLRNKVFCSLMRQDVSWYEKSNSSVGHLCLILSRDVENVKMTLNSHMNSITTILRDVIMNIRTIRFLNAEAEFEKLYSENSHIKHTRKDKINSYFLAGLSSFIDTLSHVSTLFLGLMTPSMFFHDQITLLNFSRAWSVALMSNMFGRSISVVPNIISAMTSVDKIFEVIDQVPDIENSSKDRITLKGNDDVGSVELQNVSFSYPSRLKSLALNEFNIKIDSHQTVAIVGSSGSGKSTFLQLAARFYQPQSGHVLVGNEYVNNMKLDSLREKMAIVQQEPMIFNRSIADNIAYGDLTRVVSLEEIVEAAIVAQVHHFITNLPFGYETVVGSRGTQLSGGQKQRIAIARALIRKPQILFLDEATSALDSQTDKKLQLALRQKKNRSTIVIIAHRLSTITDADKIFVVEDGKVVEFGSHAALMEVKGKYKSLYTNQMSNDNQWDNSMGIILYFPRSHPQGRTSFVGQNMLSRIALRSGVSLASVRVAPAAQIRVCHHEAVEDERRKNLLAKIKEGPERDLVNFPRRIRPLYPGKVRLGFIPDEWFQFFYKKTGVTGPYVFGGGLLTYLFSKELWVIEHEFYTGISLTILVTVIAKKFGPQVAAFLDKKLDQDEAMWKNYRHKHIKHFEDQIAAEKDSQSKAEGQKYLFDAKRENILLQLEADYRNRLMNVYTEVKKRLDYQLELQNASRRIEQKHMVNWIVNNVLKTISPQQEKEALQLCVANLKRLAAQPH
ncbi:hypothetical protein CHUAL_004424 [Chamberlinius hualienensis]